MIAQAGKDEPCAPGCLPNASQRLLLQAACAPAVVALPAWQMWLQRHDLRHPDPASVRLLVWILQRREDLRLSAEEASALEPFYRFTWLRNQRLLNGAASVIRALEAHGIDALVVKGIPLLVEAYEDEGTRYMEDFDLIVKEEDIRKLIPLFAELGWKPQSPELFSMDVLHLRHSYEFLQPDGLSCDIHWRLLRPPNDMVDEEPLWLSKRPIRVRDVDAFTVSIEHMLLHLFVHGMSWERIPPIRWILDVHLLLQRHSAEWSSVLAEAKRRGVMLSVAEAMEIYDQIAPGQIPAEVRHEAAQFRATRKQRLAYEQATRPYENTSWRAALAIHIADWKQARALGRIGPSPRETVRHLCLYWRVTSPWHLPAECGRRIYKRLLKRQHFL